MPPTRSITEGAFDLGGGIFSFGADNPIYSLQVISKVPVAAGNAYGIPSQMGITLIEMGTSNSWWGGLGADIGSVTITTFDANRLVASFSGTLPVLSGAPAAKTVTGGAINAFLETS